MCALKEPEYAAATVCVLLSKVERSCGSMCALKEPEYAAAAVCVL